MSAPKSAIAIARPRGAYLAFAAAGLGLVCIVVALVMIRGALAFMSYVVLACAAVLTLGAISVLYGAMARGPVLTVSDEGIMDPTTLFAVGLVRWGEIAGLASFRFYAQRYLLIALKDPKAFATRLGPLPRMSVELNRVLSPAPICIPSVLLGDIDELLARIEKHYSDQLASQGIPVRR